MTVNQTLPVVAGVEITTDEEGRFNLNSLHEASGGAKRAGPSYWLTLGGTKSLVAELSNQTTEISVVTKEGKNGGTFAHKLLAISYAGWISPSFQLTVNQVFLDYQTGKLAAFEIPSSYSGALRLAADEMERADKAESALIEVQPKVDFHDHVSKAVNAQTFRDVAKVLGTGRNRFTAWLRELSMLSKDNLPYQQFEDSGYFRVVEKKRKDPRSGEFFTYTQTLITSKGLIYLQKKWFENQGEAA